jgi:hypothetical protein
MDQLEQRAASPAILARADLKKATGAATNHEDIQAKK